MATAVPAHLIRDDRDYECHMVDIHYYPVQHGLVNRVMEMVIAQRQPR